MNWIFAENFSDDCVCMVKSFIFSIFSLLAFGLTFFDATGSMALDEEGCLICHRYPGLVRLEKAGGSKVFHIDEEKFFSSTHGKFPCKACHINIAQVPHTGETRVDCSTRCHRGVDADVLPEDYSLKGFHQNEQSFIVSLKEESSCRVCHSLYPHSLDPLVRGFLNMHTGFMFCEVCHVKREKYKPLTYDWENTENAEYSGSPYGTYFNPTTGKSHKSEEFISRIAAFSAKEGNRKLLINTWDIARAEKYLETEDSMTLDEKKKKLDYFHRDISRKEISVACNECHSSEGILSFEDLGFDEKRSRDLVYLNIKGLVTKYKIFYFPDLFGD